METQLCLTISQFSATYPGNVLVQERRACVPTILTVEGGTRMKSSNEVGTKKPLKASKSWCGHPGGRQMSKAEVTITGCSSSPLLSQRVSDLALPPTVLAISSLLCVLGDKE